MVTLVSMSGFSNDLLETNFSTSWVKVASTKNDRGRKTIKAINKNRREQQSMLFKTKDKLGNWKLFFVYLAYESTFHKSYVTRPSRLWFVSPFSGWCGPFGPKKQIKMMRKMITGALLKQLRATFSKNQAKSSFRGSSRFLSTYF